MSGMQDPSSLSDEQLERARDLGGATYLSAYVTLMSRKLDIDIIPEALRPMVLKMIIPVNLATEAAWCAQTNDLAGMNRTLERLRVLLEETM